ncbi:MAG TPA: hypothetical protein VM639_02210 [Dongiaceae bacterium]|nr:hypothetical protein [Dongiaceae bacterium]
MRLVQPLVTSFLALFLAANLPASPISGEAQAQENAPAESPAPDTGNSEAAGAAAKPAEDGWPCEQRLQPELSIGAVWSGPDPTAAEDNWRQDTAVETLVSQVAPRRLPQSEAIAAIHRFAAGYDKDRADTMTKVFAGIFETLNQERGQIIRGIRHFNDRQKNLADRIQAGTKALDNLDPNSTDQAVAEQRAALQQAVDWDSRIFDDRERLLPIICGVPVTIEQRLFALSRAIGGEIMPKN